MAISKRFPIPFEVVFEFGAYLVSEVSPVVDFDRSTRENKVQQLDPDTGKPLWQVDVVDGDPSVKRAFKTVTIKIAAKVQPVPPSNDGSSPFTPVAFEGMTALPYVEKVSEEFSRINWSLRAEEITEPRRNTTTSNGASTGTGATKSDQAAAAGAAGQSKSSGSAAA